VPVDQYKTDNLVDLVEELVTLIKLVDLEIHQEQVLLKEILVTLQITLGVEVAVEPLKLEALELVVLTEQVELELEQQSMTEMLVVNLLGEFGTSQVVEVETQVVLAD